MAYPVLASLFYSFSDYSVLKTPVFIGLANFGALMHDFVFWIALKNTAYFALISLPLSMVLTLGLAMLLNAKVKGQSFYRTIFYLPSLMPMVATACVFLWMFNSDNGLVNNLLLKGAGFLNWMHIPVSFKSPPLAKRPRLVQANHYPAVALGRRKHDDHISRPDCKMCPNPFTKRRIWMAQPLGRKQKRLPSR